MSWYVLYTKPRAEKKVATNLTQIGVEVFCPLVTEVRQWSDRKKKLQVPLFTSYVFVKLQEAQRELVFSVPGVVRYLFWLGKPAVVKDKEIATIQDWLSDERTESLAIDSLTPGDKIILSGGAFKDQEAIIKKVDEKSSRLILPKMGCTVIMKTKDVLQLRK